MRDRIGRYELVELLGTGSFAAVYRAHDPALDADVAIKLLGDHHAHVPDIRERFIAEARLARRLASDRLVTVHDIGEVDGQPYLVMELVPGGTLAARLDERPVAVDALDRVVVELGACLAAVHAGGVVHRDVKPSNVLVRLAAGAGDVAADDGASVLAAGERLVLADFGLARAIDATGVTVAGGTDGFSAPEQRVPSTTIDARADLYSATATVMAAMYGRSATITELRERAGDRSSRAVVAALATGLADDPADRFATSEAWTAAMRDAVAAWGGSGAVPSAPPFVHRRVARRRMLVAVAVAAVATLAGVVYVVARDTAPSNPPSDERVSQDGPQIIGPDTLLIGEPGTYIHEARPGVTYRWTDATGATTDAASIEVVPAGPDDLTISLTESDDGVERTSTLVIRVRTR
jgi:eukaryotic-like serine/threonine-protein kinase